MHGPLSEIGLIEVLQLLERGGRSGLLRVVGPDHDAPRTLRVAHGRVVALDPDASDDAVTRALVRRHELAPDATVERTIDVAHREAVRTELARVALATMLHWARGRFDFEADAPGTGPLHWSPDALVLDLVATESHRAELAEALAGWGGRPVLAPASRVADGDRVTLGPLDWRILDAADGRRDLAALAAHLGEPLEAVGDRVRELVAAAILQLHDPVVDATQQARMAIDSGRYDEAVERLRARVSEAPADGEAWRTLGLAEVGAGRFDRAIAAWTAWQAALPDESGDADALIRAARTMMEALSASRD
jgi:hypothetical protein